MTRYNKRHSTTSCIRGFLENKTSRIGRTMCKMCDHYAMGNPIYVFFLGLIGTITSTLEIIRVMNHRSTETRPDKAMVHLVPLNVERDLHLMTSILGVEHYALIMLGAITEYPMLHTPWLLMNLCIFVVGLITFIVCITFNGFQMTRENILFTILMGHNWIQVFCLFHQQVRYSG